MRHWTATCKLPSFRSLELDPNLSHPRERESTGTGRMNTRAISSTGPVFSVHAEKMDSRLRGNDGPQEYLSVLRTSQGDKTE